ncbi:hypothetical protein Mbo2_115 [Rhodococcus phage Mbo2]|uniref:Uncharacterized protein n=1 Tax=Rhodococcus phage Mbo2 TaxID=2936911 RepID=A0A9E7LF45_9CAUD|nr:hypothetical protein Mbo2_115 [Rhodococcus phage Mbo2]
MITPGNREHRRRIARCKHRDSAIKITDGRAIRFCWDCMSDTDLGDADLILDVADRAGGTS